jgi:hypothetical protein
MSSLCSYSLAAPDPKKKTVLEAMLRGYRFDQI